MQIYKKQLVNVLIFLFIIINSAAQNEGRFGVKASMTNYLPKSNVLFAKSSLGYGVGIIGTNIINDKFEVFVEVNYSRHYVYFVGRETLLSEPEDVKYYLENFNFPISMEYTYYNIDNRIFFTVDAGLTIAMFYDYRIFDDDKEGYSLDPMYASNKYVQFDTYFNNEKPTFNLFLETGLGVEFDRYKLGLQYLKHLTDPYRKAPKNPFIDVKGKDMYFALSLTIIQSKS